ncbi:hypothetical protein [Lutimonas zeaxanthinifaciens]|uniref:hypothetical protein n=1 Tax=Lutimonas zeaxanthinifaciens TaxID=3060215 RepID=UPI00265D24B1|nr:hypothetical protein [Lutimonas sp. YSD2104]WKK67190.1 hypothetical protein QZH61_06085 [Lutimonas sp. YSD2104]
MFWLFLFGLLLIDDALGLHEHIGNYVANKFSYEGAIRLRPQDLGELTYILLAGSIILVFLVFSFKMGNRNFKFTSLDITILLGIFLFFAIGIDTLGPMIEHNNYTYLFVVVLEEGGEMISLSLITWYFHNLALKPKNSENYLFQIFWSDKKKDLVLDSNQ